MVDKKLQEKLDQLKVEELSKVETMIDFMYYAEVPYDYKRENIVSIDFLNQMEENGNKIIKDSFIIYKQSEQIRDKLDIEVKKNIDELNSKLKIKKDEIKEFFPESAIIYD